MDASTGLTEDLALGRQIVTMIDASLTHALKSDSSTLASWRQTKRATVKGVVSRAGVGGGPIVVGGGSPVVGGGSPVAGSGSVAASAVPAVASGGFGLQQRCSGGTQSRPGREHWRNTDGQSRPGGHVGRGSAVAELVR